MVEMKQSVINIAATHKAIVGKIISNLRRKLQIKQSEVAKEIGINQSTLSRIENGESFLTVEQLIKFARFLKIKPGIVLTEIENTEQRLIRDN
jgi:transcriptional regulator with XRE-family HTH domain